jgi:hypothetical protein
MALLAACFAPQAHAHEGGEPHSHDEAAPAAQPTPPAPAADDADELPSVEPPAEESDADAYALPPPLNDEEAPGAYRPRTIQDHSWRRQVRRGEETGSKYLTLSHFYFELRFGPYSPNVDEEFEGGAGCGGQDCTPYTDFFGDDPLFYFGLEIDWLPLRIPYVLSLGAGYGWGITSAGGNAKTLAGGEAGSETDLSIHAMYASGVARFDGPLRELGIPIVPYIKAGLGIGLWTASGPNDGAEGRAEGAGNSLGLHLAIGGAIALNAFDQTAAMAMKETTGISYANLYGEWMLLDLGGSNSMQVGTSTVVLGLALDF